MSKCKKKLFHESLLFMPFPKHPLLKMITFKMPVQWPVKVGKHFVFFIILGNNSASSKNKNIKCLPTLTGHYTGILKVIILSRGCFRNGMDRRLSWNNFFYILTYFHTLKKMGNWCILPFFGKKGQNRPKNGTFLSFLLFFLPKHQNITQVQPLEVLGIPHDP